MEPSLTTRLLSLPQGTHQSLGFNQLLHQIYYLALLLHLGFFVIFLFLGIGSLALFNLASVVAYVLARVLHHGRHWSSALLLVYVDVVLHAILATMLLGWMAGFPYYLFAVGPVVLLNTQWPLLFRLALALLAIVIKGLLYLFFGGMEADHSLLEVAPEILGLLHVGNTVAVYFTLGFIVYTYGVIAKQAVNQLMAASAEWERKAHLDMLTGIYNRRAMDELLKKEASRTGRSACCFAIAIVDIDNFKAINDTHGHDVGDNVIRHVATCIRDNIRTHDAVGRWGGEEFLVMLTEADDAVTPRILENLRSRIVASASEAADIPNYTVSIGSAIFRPGDDVEAVLKKADDALYQGKKSGKNVLVHFSA